jgi:hypothetical protein
MLLFSDIISIRQANWKSDAEIFRWYVIFWFIYLQISHWESGSERVNINKLCFQ